MSEPIVLGIESTCDETAAAVVQGRTLISNVVASSMDEHARYGGVIPEIASRAHAEAFVPCVSKALADANMTLSDVDAIADLAVELGLAGIVATNTTISRISTRGMRSLRPRLALTRARSWPDTCPASSCVWCRPGLSCTATS